MIISGTYLLILTVHLVSHPVLHTLALLSINLEFYFLRTRVHLLHEDQRMTGIKVV